MGAPCRKFGATAAGDAAASRPAVAQVARIDRARPHPRHRPAPSMDPTRLTITEVPPPEHEALVPLLLLAEPSRSALRWSLANLSDTVYRVEADGALVAAATVRWDDEPSEIVELGVDPAHQGEGVGRWTVAWLVGEARRRGRRALEVGTGNASIGNIAFYQKCGFRMARVRQDYFWYYDEPQVENGIVVRDLLVFRYDLADAAPNARRRRAR